MVDAKHCQKVKYDFFLIHYLWKYHAAADDDISFVRQQSKGIVCLFLTLSPTHFLYQYQLNNLNDDEDDDDDCSKVSNKMKQ